MEEYTLVRQPCPWCCGELVTGGVNALMPWHLEDSRGCVGSGLEPAEAEALAKIRDAEGGRLTRAAHP